jgi:CubicO group peptidase (beta-lactamase class C family)
VAVLRGGHIVYLRGYGVAAPAHDGQPARPMRPNTVMRGASLTKAAFAWTVVQLADEGRLSLDQPLAEALAQPLPATPEWADLAGDGRWRDLTLRQLLSHQSGLLNWRFINLNQKLDFKFSPGERYVYSGEGIQIAQKVVEERTGRTAEALMHERIAQPLGLRDQRLSTSAPQAEQWGPRLALPVADDGRVLPPRLSGRARAAGSMATTPADYAAFLRAVLRREGLSPAAHRDMLRPQIAVVSPRQFPSHWPGQTAVNQPIGLGAGLGWVVYRGPYGRTFFKEGHDTGVSHLALGFADRGDGLLLMSNSNRAEAIFWAVTELLWPSSCLPWYWMGLIPDDQAAWRAPQARETPRGPGLACLAALRDGPPSVR